MMAIQTVLIRLAGLAFGASHFTFSIVVAVFVLCIALGSLVVSALQRIRPVLLVGNQWALVVVLLLLYWRLDEAPYWVHLLRTLFRDAEAAFRPYFFAGFLGILVVIGPAVAFSGATLPLLFHHARRSAGELGATAGRIYAWNTVGSLLGALLGGYTLLIWLDLHHVYRIALAALVGAAAILTLRIYGALRLATAGVAAALAVGLLLLQPWEPRLLASGLFRYRKALPETGRGPHALVAALKPGSQLVFYEDDPTTTVSVNEWRFRSGALVRSIITNGKPDGTTRGDYPTMALAALLPTLFAQKMERAFVIGYGTGVTVGELAALDSTREVVVAEISSGVLKAAPLFEFANLEAATSPKVELIRSDAYRALLRSQRKFDAIVSEPSNPWVTGVEMLFSREFLDAARSRLAPGGVYVQWYHQYESDIASAELVLRTFADVFEEVAVWYGARADLLILGFEDAGAALDLERLARRTARPDLAAGLRRSGIDGFPELLAHELVPLGVVHAAALRGPLHTLLHPLLSDRAARAFYRGAGSRVPFTGFGEAARIGARNSLLGRYVRRAGGRLPADQRAAVVGESCSHRTAQCGAFLADWLRERPDSPALRRAIAASAAPGRMMGAPWMRRPCDASPSCSRVGSGRNAGRPRRTPRSAGPISTSASTNTPFPSHSEGCSTAGVAVATTASAVPAATAWNARGRCWRAGASACSRRPPALGLCRKSAEGRVRPGWHEDPEGSKR